VVSLPEEVVAEPVALVPIEDPEMAFVVSLAPEFPTEPESAAAPPVFGLLLHAEKVNPAAINIIKLNFFMIKEVFKVTSQLNNFCLL